jgi:hypothetical protein
MKKALLTMAAALMTLAPMTASAAVRHVVVVHRPHYYYGGFYRPFWGAYWGPSYWGPTYSYYDNTGEVKLETKVKDAEVFINGAYAGSTKDNKHMHLRPGNYKIEIRQGGQTEFAQNVYVVAGKTVQLYPEL